MSAKVSLIVLRTPESYVLFYHKDLVDPVKESSGDIWSHPSIMKSHLFEFGPNQETFDLNDLLDGNKGKWAETKKGRPADVMDQPHIRLEVTNTKSSDPFDKSISDEDFIQCMNFRYDNPSGFDKAGANLPREFKDDQMLEKLIAQGIYPAQPWALRFLRSIHRRVTADMVAMKAGTWKNPGLKFEDLGPFVHPQDKYLSKVKDIDLKVDPSTGTRCLQRMSPKTTLKDGSIIRSIVRGKNKTDEIRSDIINSTTGTSYLIEEWVSPCGSHLARYILNIDPKDRTKFRFDTVVSEGFHPDMLAAAREVIPDGVSPDVRRICRTDPSTYRRVAIKDKRAFQMISHKPVAEAATAKS
jgi:hypothetical protein